MRQLALLLLAAVLAGCAAPSPRQAKIDPRIAAELNKAADDPRPGPVESDIRDALLPPLKLEMPGAAAKPIEPRFDLSVNEAPAAQVFMSIVSGTRYSMLVHSDVKGTVTVNLKDVTVREALDALRDLYGYEYHFDGTRILIQATGIRTRVFRVNYLIGQRLGRSDIRVTSGSVADAPTGSTGAGIPGVPGTTGLPTAPTQTGGASAMSSGMSDSSRVQTSVQNDFWEDLRQTLTQIIGREGGRNVVVNPQAGLVVVRAMPEELRQIDAYLRAIRLSVERQVMLEAKIVEVTLSDEYQTGVNWALFSSSGRSSLGLITPDTTLATTGANTSGNLSVSPQPGSAALQAGAAAAALIPGLPGGSLFGLAFQTANFSALLSFLESQGSVQVLSSPRVATINNQMAVLKVGTDQFFITNIAGGTGTTGTTVGNTTSFPTLTMRPFFSGVALDITPQIDEDSSVVLHIHPSVSNVQQDDKVVNLGAVFGGQITLPLARSTVSETDSIVRVRNSNIVAIGGLMKLDTADGRSGLPGLQDAPRVGGLFGSGRRAAVKKELIILIKPTVIQSEGDWDADIRESRDRILNMGGGSSDESGVAAPRR
ncbi:MAG: secretin N-terminal domain-containing protein [Pseudomonadota bacterium]